MVYALAVLMPLGVFATAIWLGAHAFWSRMKIRKEGIAHSREPLPLECELPAALRTFAGEVDSRAMKARPSVHLEQVGEMRTAPDAKWKAFRAEQRIAIAEPAFLWSASMGAVRVVDFLLGQESGLDVRLFAGIRLMKVRGDGVTRGQLLRYLGEIPWCPAAIRCNPAIRWREGTDERRVVGVITLGELAGELEFEFDERGDISTVRGTRPRTVGAHQVETPWEGRFFQYESVAGVRIPTRAEVQWTLDSGVFTYWRATITSYERELVRRVAVAESRSRATPAAK